MFDVYSQYTQITAGHTKTRPTCIKREQKAERDYSQYVSRLLFACCCSTYGDLALRSPPDLLLRTPSPVLIPRLLFYTHSYPYLISKGATVTDYTDFLTTRTLGPSNVFTMLNGCTGISVLD